MFRLIGISIVVSMLSFNAMAQGFENLRQQVNAEKCEPAFPQLKGLAEQGDLAAQVVLSNAYANGTCTLPDGRLAVAWSLKGAEKGNAAAQAALGFLYEVGMAPGVGFPSRLQKAGDWYEKAAIQGNAFAQYSLANLYAIGFGVSKYDKQAELDWMRKAAAQGYQAAEVELMIHQISGFGIAKDPRKGLDALTKAAERGSAYAQFKLGQMYLVGSPDVSKDEALAIRWLQAASGQGDVAATMTLASEYEHGTFTYRPDKRKSAELYGKLAEKGNVVSMRKVASMHIAGDGVLQDFAAAAGWYEKAARKGDSKAQCALASMMVDGKSMPPDAIRAHAWMNVLALHAEGDGWKTPREQVARVLNQAQTAEAQRLAREWRWGSLVGIPRLKGPTRVSINIDCIREEAPMPAPAASTG